MAKDYYSGSAVRIAELREQREIGVHEAKRIAKGERLLWIIEHHRDNPDTMADVLAEVIEDLYRTGEA